MTSHGEPIGGVVGFLKSLSYLVNTFSPSIVFNALESGGNSRRRNIYPEYKKGVKPLKLNRYYEEDIPNTFENKIKQSLILIKLLDKTPVQQLFVEDCEGDDIINYICSKYVDYNIVIVSTDRDYYQLVSEKIKIYNPIKKTIVTEKEIIKEYFIQPCNFAIAKSICGDYSDNISGVKGCGFKTIAKKVPMLMSKQNLLLDDVIKFISSKRNDEKFYMSVFNEISIIKRNWKLVYLTTNNLSSYQINKLEYMIDNHQKKFDINSFVQLLNEFSIINFDISLFSQSIKKLL
jgi:DNA polymerase-1